MAGKRRQREHEHGTRRGRPQRPADIPTTASQSTATAETSGASPLAPPSDSATNTPPGRGLSHRTLANATVPTATPATREPLTQRLATAADDDAGADADAPLTTPATIRVERALTASEEGGAHALAPQRAATSPAILIRGAKKPPRLSAHIVPRRTGPRSAAAQFISSMVVVIAFASAIALASPLGSATGLTQTFQAYANAVPFIPTPTPRPTPVPQGGQPAHSADPGKQAIINEITTVFGPYAQGALNVARCESGYDPNAWNPYAIGNSHASGVFQILYPSTWNGTSYASSSPFNAGANIHAAYEMFKRDGYSWREWACQP